MNKLRVAIIGQGRSGRDIHGAWLQTDVAKEKFEVVAIVDQNPERRVRAAEEFGCSVYEKYQDLFDHQDEIDLVVNSTYSFQHAPISIDLLEHGFNVVCEKPACRNVAEFDAMTEAAEKSGKFLGIFQQSRFAPYFVKVKEIIGSGVLGDLIEVDIQFNGYARRWDWQTLDSFNGGGLRNTGPHPLDQALNILDNYDEMPNVFCKMNLVNTFGDANDYCKLILTAPNKPLIDLTISSCDAYPCFTYKIHGQKGGLKGNMQHIDWKYFDPEQAPEQHLIRESLSKEDGTPAYCGEKLPWVEEYWDGDPNAVFNASVGTYYNMVYEHIVNNVPLAITLKQVRQQVAVFEEAHRQNPIPTID